MAIAAIVPVLWGLATDNILRASWMTLTAECICWVELKGTYTQRVSILFVGVLLALCFAALGTVTANYLFVGVVAIFFVCFLAGLFKNLGDRGGGLALCIYVTFIVCNAYPVHSREELNDRMFLILIGGLWTMLVGVVGSLFIPLRQPYRRSIALIWKANASLLNAIAKGWDGKGLRNSLSDIYQQERLVRTAIDSSLTLFENRSSHTKNVPLKEQELAKLRKLTALVGVHIVTIGKEVGDMRMNEFKEDERLKLHEAIFQMQQVVSKMGVYTVMLKPESLLIVHGAIDKANTSVNALKELAAQIDHHQHSIKRIVQLCERSIRLVETGVMHLEKIGGDNPVYSSYSFLKTLYLLQPRKWIKNTKLLFNFNTLTVRYILRSSLAAALAIFIYKWLHVDHGYWLAFTVILVMQPYFGATLKKAIDRVVGTLVGGIVGGLLAKLNDVFYTKEIILFVCFVAMVYYLRKNYTYAAFFITVSLVLLFDAEYQNVDSNIIMMRAISTIGGACLGILAGFLLLPDWDSKWLPRHIVKAVNSNYNYFTTSFYKDKEEDWTKMKRLAETANSDAFDSFNRYLSEPTINKRPTLTLYHIILHNVHITRELNSFHIEDGIELEEQIMAADQMLRINECLYWFNKTMVLLKQIDASEKPEFYQSEDLQVIKHSYTTHQMFYIGKMLDELKVLHQNINTLAGIVRERSL